MLSVDALLDWPCCCAYAAETATKLASKEADYDPLCPHCEERIGEVHWRMVEAVNAEYLFMCPSCRKMPKKRRTDWRTATGYHLVKSDCEMMPN